jgi:hypothetical protein
MCYILSVIRLSRLYTKDVIQSQHKSELWCILRPDTRFMFNVIQQYSCALRSGSFFFHYYEYNSSFLNVGIILHRIWWTMEQYTWICYPLNKLDKCWHARISFRNIPGSNLVSSSSSSTALRGPWPSSEVSASWSIRLLLLQISWQESSPGGCQPHAQPPAILEGRCFLSGRQDLAFCPCVT